MGTTPCRRLVPVLTVALSAALVGAVAAPAQARAVRDDRMPVTVSARPLGTAPAAATTSATRVVTTWPTPVRRVTRVSATSAEAAEVVRLVNVARKKAGCAAVHTDARLAAAARLHSEDMARRSYFSHTSLDGRTPWDRIRAQGYAYGSAENIAAGYAHPGRGDDRLDEQHGPQGQHPQLLEQGPRGRRRAWRELRHLLDPGLRQPLTPPRSTPDPTTRPPDHP